MNVLNKKVLEWLFDDGISIRMITDVKRNEYFEKIIKESVCNKRCIDVGFGTGLLSLLALKHGAKSITAYESNSDRYALGIEIIDYLNLNDKIELINKKFDTSYIKETDEIIIHEIIGSALYNESVYCLFNQKVKVCPSNYKTDFFLYEVNDIDIESLRLTLPINSESNRVQKEFYKYANEKLTTGLEIDEKYNDKVFGLINEYIQYQYNNPVQKLNNKIVNDFTPKQFKMFESLTNGKLACTIEIDYTESKTYIESKVNKELLKNKTMIIVPAYSFSNNGYIFDLKDTHWNERTAWQESAILNNVNKDLYIRQNLTNGQIDYWIKES